MTASGDQYFIFFLGEHLTFKLKKKELSGIFKKMTEWKTNFIVINTCLYTSKCYYLHNYTYFVWMKWRILLNQITGLTDKNTNASM